MHRYHQRRGSDSDASPHPIDQDVYAVDTNFLRIGPPRLFPSASVVATLVVSKENQDAISDANGSSPIMISVAYDAEGSRVGGAVIQYHVEDDGGTGSGFRVEGVDHLLMDSIAVTQDDGAAYPIDRWVTGPNPGTARIRATPVNGAPDAPIVYSRTVSDRTPTTLTIVSGGEVIRCRPGGIVDREVTVELRDDRNDPVTWGRVVVDLVDDDKTHSGRSSAIPSFDQYGRLTARVSVACWFWRAGPTKRFHLEVYRPGHYEATRNDIPCELILVESPSR